MSLYGELYPYKPKTLGIDTHNADLRITSIQNCQLDCQFLTQTQVTKAAAYANPECPLLSINTPGGYMICSHRIYDIL